MRKLIRGIALSFGTICALVLIYLAIKWVVLSKYFRARAAWKVLTVAELSTLSVANEEVAAEIQTLKSGPPQTEDQHLKWTGDKVLLMKNGDHMLYRFWHGFNNGAVDHLFLARASDGQWWYSTYHFCNNMVSVVGEEQPKSIAEFVTRYSCRSFNPRSESELKRIPH